MQNTFLPTFHMPWVTMQALKSLRKSLTRPRYEADFQLFIQLAIDAQKKKLKDEATLLEKLF